MSRKVRIILIVVVCLLALPVLLVMFENWRGKHDWEQYKAVMEAHGEHLDFSYYIPPEVPDEKNFMLNPALAPAFSEPLAPVFKEGGSFVALNKISPYVLLDPSSAKKTPPQSTGRWNMGTRNDDLKGWQEYYRGELHDVTLDKSPAEDVLAALARYDGVFAALRDAEATRPLSRAPLAYEKGFMMSFSHYSVMQGMVKVLALRARAELELNRTDDALADLQLGFRLLGATWDEKFLLSGLVRVTWMAIMMQPVWEGIALHRWTDAQLGQIGEELRKLDFLADYEGVMRGERAASNFNHDRVRANPDIGIAQTTYSGDKYEKALMSCARYFPGLLYQNQISSNQLVQAKILPLADVKGHRFNVQKEMRSDEYFKDTRNFSPYSYLARSTLRNYMIIDEKYAYTQVCVDEARIACEIERYRIAHGSLPATLEALHMADLPCDVINGGPLHYRVKGEDYILYSVGWNETDDGGKIVFASDSNTRVDQKQGDWVWSLKPL